MIPGGPTDQAGLGSGGAGGPGGAAELGLLEHKPREQSGGCQGWALEPGAGRWRSEGRHAAASAHTLLTTPLPWVVYHSMSGITFGTGARTEEHLGSNGLGRQLALIPLLALSSQNLLSALLSVEL